MDLKGKRALVTGSSRGIGRAIARALAGAGASLYLTGRDSKRLARVKEEVSADGRKIDCAEADLRDKDEVKGLFDSAIKFLGGVDILINNAGLGIKGNVVDMSISDWDLTLSVNLRAPFLLCRLAAAEMIRQKSGHIINIGSGASKTPIAGFASYAASKHGLLGFSESLALELREYNVKVSIILPGSTATHFGGGDPESRIQSKPGILLPEDIANSVLYLLRQDDRAWTSVMNLRPLNPSRGGR